jgi:hypothetical protein
MVPPFCHFFKMLFLKCSCSEKCAAVFVSMTLLIGLYTMVAWNIYGYTEYFSAENHCAGGWMWAMGFLLFFGAFFILAGSCLICVIGMACVNGRMRMISSLLQMDVEE